MADHNEAVRYLGDLSKLEVRPNDVMVLQVGSRLTYDQMTRLTDRMETIFGKGRVVVLEEGMTLGAVEMRPPIIHVDEAGTVTFP